MYIYQNDKLYVEDGNILVGVEIYPDCIKKISGTETKLADNFLCLTHSDVYNKFQIEFTPYIFPIEKKEEQGVIEDGDKPTITKAKTSTRKSK